ncbi:MAG: DUF896 domain-containing protein [Oscillospiraceae bacterium]|nr:DUF896 domain-containing protein [Oscillospiraceae bacterium]
MTQEERIKKLNEFTAKAREGTLTEEEAKEREVLRKEYLEIIKGNLIMTLDNTYVKELDGTKRKLKKKE